MWRTWCAVAVVVVAVPAAASAQHWSAHVEGVAQAGWTDNIISSPDDDDPTTPEPEADIYYQIQPGARFAYESPRTIQQLTYGFSAYLYQEHSEANSYNHNLRYGLFWLTGPRSEMTFHVGGATGQVNTFQLGGDPSMGGVDPVPGGTSTYYQLEAGQMARLQIDPNWRATEELSTRLFTSQAELGMATTETFGYDIGLSLGGDRSWAEQGIGFTVSSHFISLQQEGEGVPDEDEDPRDQVNVGLEIGYRRDLSRQWAGRLHAGVTALIPIDQEDASTAFQPTAGATANYFLQRGGTFTFLAERSVAPNLYIAENTVATHFLVNAWYPLRWRAHAPLDPLFAVGGSAGYQRGHRIDLTDNTLSSAWNVYLADAAVFITPQSVPLRISVRYQFVYQDGVDDGSLPVAFPSYMRNTVMITVGGRYPTRVAAEVPIREGLRVDGSDLRPLGDQRSGTGEEL